MELGVLVGCGSIVSLGILVGRSGVAVGEAGTGDGPSWITAEGMPQASKVSIKNATKKKRL